jgi:hypothetical protein
MEYFKLDGHEVVAVEDLLEWARWFETADRCVMQTKLIDGSRISTVFLGIDHGWDGKPQLFETALFSGEKHYCPILHREASECEVVARYATWGEAVDGHLSWIEQCVPADMIAATAQGTP